MTFPADWTRIRVTGKYLLGDGTPARGRVVFSSPQIVRIDDTIVLPVDYVAPLDADGAIAIDLPATNDPDVTPAGWAWRVSECIDGARGRRYAIFVDADGGDIDLATVAPVVPPPLMGLPGGGGGSGDGITQTQADARYVRLVQVNAPNGVPSLDVNKYLSEDRLPLPPVTLTVLFANKLA